MNNKSRIDDFTKMIIDTLVNSGIEEHNLFKESIRCIINDVYRDGYEDGLGNGWWKEQDSYANKDGK